MNFRLVIFVICFLELVWYTFSIGASWFEIGKIYYDWSMRLRETIEISEISWLSVGIIAPTISLVATLALFYVAFTDGKCLPMTFLYIAKNSLTVTLEIFFFGRYILDLVDGSTELDQGPLSVLMFIFCGIFAPILFSLVSFKYYRFVRARDDVARMILKRYERLTQNTNTFDKGVKRGRGRPKGRKVKKI